MPAAALQCGLPDQMTCSDFQDRFSDYFDRTCEPGLMAEMAGHLEGCPECRRYRNVVEQGVRILKAVPPPSVAEDFLPRLRHRIYHLEDGRALDREIGSATTTATALAIAVLIAAAAWSPLLLQAPEVALEPIVVTEPELRSVGIRTPPYGLLAGDATPRRVMQGGLWDDPLLFARYSPLSAGRRRSTTALRQADLE